MTNDPSNQLKTLRGHRPLLLACEAIGWLHMAGKAKADFLRHHGGQPNNYHYEHWFEGERPPFLWSDLLQWVKNKYPLDSNTWPSSLTEFIAKHREQHRGLLGLLQAGHAMASGIEKQSYPDPTVQYLGQDATHLWLSSAFGHPARNLLQDPPEVLTDAGWSRLVQEIQHILEELKKLGENNTKDVESWWRWREEAIGRNSYLRQAFLSTLAETRLPNNDVTLWDQSYVAAALFKSAVAGAVLSSPFSWNDSSLKQKTRWRVLTVGFGAQHYEARAVRIGDWIGARRDINEFFDKVRRLIEVDLALGSLVYRDDEALVFTFPGLSQDGQLGLSDDSAEKLRQAIEDKIDQLANGKAFETPPLCTLSASTRSFVGMVKELRKVKDRLAIPLHKSWAIPQNSSKASTSSGHVCPVCHVRLNQPRGDDATENARKQRVCDVCERRRRGRLDDWLKGKEDTVWIDEVADENDRVALLTFSLDIEPWLEGERVDSLRAQSIANWRRFNPQVAGKDNPVDPTKPFASLNDYIRSNLASFNKSDPVLTSLQEGYRHESRWEDFFAKIVEDRADAPAWDNLDDTYRAHWLVHQLFRKLPSPGRVYRFWRNAETFFDDLLVRFQEIASAHPNRWRVRRLLLIPDNAHSHWKDRETYSARWREAPLELLWLEDKGHFLTITNLARCFQAHEVGTVLQEQKLELTDDNGRVHELTVKTVKELDDPGELGVYTPLIPLDHSPQRFRVLVPLDRATGCIEAAVEKWREEFSRVWDRLPLRIGVIAFPRLTPFQAVIEATRNLEESLAKGGTETWRVCDARRRHSVAGLSLERCDGGRELVLVPVRLPDGREDVFYPYLEVQEHQVRFPFDFQHPKGQVYRYVGDLRRGDGIVVHPSRFAAIFLDTTARRFERQQVWPLAEFQQMRESWELVSRFAPSLTALRGAWEELMGRRTQWSDARGHWFPGGQQQWLDLLRAVMADRWQVSGAALETLVEAARDEVLEWALEWHLTWLKQGLEEKR